MSLHSKLWLAIVALLLLVFCGSFIASTLSARSFLAQQISATNEDNASALALSLGQQAVNGKLTASTLSGQFDSGSYQLLELRDTAGKLQFLRQKDEPVKSVPGWFISLVPLEAKDGSALVMSDARRVGTLTLRSDPSFAYKQLWVGANILLVTFVVAILIAGLIGGRILKRILKPLDALVDQAGALAQRRFTTIPEPKIREFQEVAHAMNDLSARIKQMLGEESRRLQKWQREAHVDNITELNTREPFLKALESVLKSDDLNASGSLSLIRLSGLSQLNQQYGRAVMDRVLRNIGRELNRIAMSHSRWSAARLNGSDFALLAPREMDPMFSAQLARTAILGVLQKHSLSDGNFIVPVATTSYSADESISGLMARLDGTLLANERDEHDGIGIAYFGDIQIQPLQEQMKAWRHVLEQAFKQHLFYLELLPLIDWDNKQVHQKAVVKLQWEGESVSAEEFLPWVNRLEMADQLDKEIINLALDTIRSTGNPVCANLSAASLVQPLFLYWLEERLSNHAAAAHKLWIEIPEALALGHIDSFKRLCSRLRSHGSKTGIEQVGHYLAELDKLHDIGVDYLKIDSSFVRNVESSIAHQALLRALCTIGHSIGLKVYADGARSPGEHKTLREVGVDGITTPGIPRRAEIA